MGKLTRKQLEDALLWNSGGTGFGICRVAGMDIWASRRPEHPRGEDDLPFTVAVMGPKEKYTYSELLKLFRFSWRRTEEYDRMFRWRLGANLIHINKQVSNQGATWMRKRMSWEYGPMWSETLDEAIAVFEQPIPR